MAYFDSQDGWIQFAFANEEDTYYLPSLTRVNFHRYLFYCLKNDGYEAVFFWNESDGKPELGYMDRESGQYYEHIRPQSFFGKLFGTTETADEQKNGEWTFVRLAGDSAMEQLFYNIAEGRKKTALVVPISVFDRFFSNKLRMEDLLDRRKRLKSLRQLVLVVSSARAEDSNQYLTKEDGIFSSMFEEIRQAIVSDSGLDFYELMKMNMGSRCQYVNSLSRNMIRNVVRRRMILDEGNDRDISWELTEQMTDVLDWYYHSEAFRTGTPISFTENRERKLQVIDKNLQNPRTCSIIRDWIEQTGEGATAQSFRAYLQRTFPRERKECHIYTNSFLLRQWEQMRIPMTGTPKEQQILSGQLDTIRTSLRALVLLKGDDRLDKVYLDSCTNQVRKSLNNGDINTFRYGLKAMQYLLDIYHSRSAVSEDVWKFYEKIFELSEEIQKLDKEIEEDNKRIQENRAEMYQIFDKIKILEKQPHDEKDGGEMNIMRQKALQCDADINLLHNICTVKNNQRFQYQQVIASIEQAIQGTTGGGIVDVESVLMKAMEMQKNVLTNSFKTIKDVSELTEKKPSDLERITGQDLTTSENLETRYQALAERMKQL